MARLTPALLLALVVASGCGGYTPTPAHPTSDELFGRPHAVIARGMADETPGPLVLLPGDIVVATLVSAETREVPGLLVDGSGRLHVPLAGDVEVAGLTLSAAEARIQEQMQRFDRFVRVSLTVREALGHRATVLGAVAHPGVVPVSPGARVADVIALAGGPAQSISDAGEHVEAADLEGARVLRNGRALPINVALAVEGDPRHNARVQPGDHFYIPSSRGRLISVFGAVEDGGVFPYRRGIRLSEVLARAGGITIDGDDDDIRVIRGPLSRPRVYVTSWQDIRDGDAHDVEMAPGDIVFVTDHWIADVGEVLDRLGPLLSVGVTGGIAAALIVSGSSSP